MNITRRAFVRLSGLSIAGICLSSSKIMRDSSQYVEKDIGIYVSSNIKDIDSTFKRINDLGFRSCELYTSSYGIEMASPLQEAMKKYGIEVIALFTLGPGKTNWDFYAGQENIGLVSREFRRARIDALIQLSELAKLCNIKMIETHVGYIPENPNDSNYKETVVALKEVVTHCAENDQVFLYHAGQETPTTLLRTIEDVGLENQGIGMDTANLIMYDRGHPVHALNIYGKYIKLVNCKDGLYPTDSRNLGKEVQIGEGQVNFPIFINKLKNIGYNGPVIIEREASRGKQWENDITQSRQFLQVLF
ncbi:sugar phosphate isomerase/epimerase family protein [Proteiniphilum sp. UBA5510]|uniref:sugar phosphate isomerase/epimerase family protein n=1 Tax=Proteiniphilum sp. UBA5510 TaxID=1947286 RepID=UPI002580403F|nr:sugar phosphate isomerase/epimerase family protein [Proteiniphilum sp. UBA5510]